MFIDAILIDQVCNWTQSNWNNLLLQFTSCSINDAHKSTHSDVNDLRFGILSIISYYCLCTFFLMHTFNCKAFIFNGVCITLEQDSWLQNDFQTTTTIINTNAAFREPNFHSSIYPFSNYAKSPMIQQYNRLTLLTGLQSNIELTTVVS